MVEQKVAFTVQNLIRGVKYQPFSSPSHSQTKMMHSNPPGQCWQAKFGGHCSGTIGFHVALNSEQINPGLRHKSVVFNMYENART